MTRPAPHPHGRLPGLRRDRGASGKAGAALRVPAPARPGSARGPRPRPRPGPARPPSSPALAQPRPPDPDPGPVFRAPSSVDSHLASAGPPQPRPRPRPSPAPALALLSPSIPLPQPRLSLALAPPGPGLPLPRPRPRPDPARRGCVLREDGGAVTSGAARVRAGPGGTARRGPGCLTCQRRRPARPAARGLLASAPGPGGRATRGDGEERDGRERRRGRAGPEVGERAGASWRRRRRRRRILPLSGPKMSQPRDSRSPTLLPVRMRTHSSHFRGPAEVPPPRGPAPRALNSRTHPPVPRTGPRHPGEPHVMALRRADWAHPTPGPPRRPARPAAFLASPRVHPARGLAIGACAHIAPPRARRTSRPARRPRRDQSA
ncbi:basic proline-rich protein-like [Symphalangus syndactylus]|uniref:basic proline-rich protein-like n=1 Tax=Symphalangus syndactylus TaxID=9590 RepID=UPI0030049A02